MSNKLNEKTYKELINEDISVLNKHLPDCLERDHIESVLKDSVNRYYPNHPALKIADELNPSGFAKQQNHDNRRIK